MLSSNFNNPEFTYFIWQKIKGSKNKKLCCKQRTLNKYYASQIQEEIIYAAVKYNKLKDLATSKFAQQIINLKLSVPVDLERVDDLRFISTKYFTNIQSIKLRFVNQNMNSEYLVPPPVKKMRINENLSIRGLTIKQHQQVRQIQISGKYELKLQNCKFEMQISVQENTNIEISGVKFLNQAPFVGFLCWNCTSLTMKDVLIFNCGMGFNIYRCQKFFASNINVKKCVNTGLSFGRVQNFEISNAKIYKCFWGLYFDHSNGKMIDVVLEECRQHGVVLENSQVRYERLQCINNYAENDVEIRGVNSAFVYVG